MNVIGERLCNLKEATAKLRTYLHWKSDCESDVTITLLDKVMSHNQAEYVNKKEQSYVNLKHHTIQGNKKVSKMLCLEENISIASALFVYITIHNVPIYMELPSNALVLEHLNALNGSRDITIFFGFASDLTLTVVECEWSLRESIH